MTTTQQELADLRAVLSMVAEAIANVLAEGKQPPACYFEVADEALNRLRHLAGASNQRN